MRDKGHRSCVASLAAMVYGTQVERVVIVGGIRGGIGQKCVATIDLCRVRWIFSQKMDRTLT